MLTNIEIIKKENKYKCNQYVMEYLTYKCGLPLLAYDGDSFYFANTAKLKAYVGKMPLLLKVSAIVIK